jgi:hypothetical protein
MEKIKINLKKSNFAAQVGIVSYDSGGKKILSKTNSIEYLTEDRYSIPGSNPSIEDIPIPTTTTTTTV